MVASQPMGTASRATEGSDHPDPEEVPWGTVRKKEKKRKASKRKDEEEEGEAEGKEEEVEDRG